MQAWKPGWRERLAERLGEAGWSSVTELATARPHVSFIDLAREVGGGVVGAQIEKVMYEEAREAGQLDRAVRRTLVRRLHERLPDGWGQGQDNEFARAQAYASWKGALEDRHSDDAWTAWQRLRDADKPADWLPRDENDPVLQAAFAGLTFA